MSHWCLLLVVLLLSSTLRAEELELIRVTSQKDVNIFTFAETIQIDDYLLETSPTSLISSSLQATEGLVSSQNGGPGGRVSFFIRGTESRHVSFTLDGLKINDPSNTDRQFDSAFMTSAFIKGVLLHKGPQAVLFGSDAMGGTVEMITRKGESPGQTRFSLNGGSFGTIDSSLSRDWSSGSNRGTFTVTRFHTDGISRLNRKRFKAKEKDSADITQLTSSSNHQWQSRVESDLLVSYLRGKNEFDTFGMDDSYDRSANDQLVLQQKTRFKLSESSSVSLRNGYTGHRRFIKSLSVGNETYQGDLLQHEFLYRRSFEESEVLAGLATDREGSESTAVDQSFLLHSVFLQGSQQVRSLKFQAGARLDGHSRYGGFGTGSTGVSFAPGPDTFSLQYSQGYKAPSLYQLYGPPIFGTPLGNEKLRPERNNSWEVSWRREFQKVGTSVTLFQNQLTNLITFSNLGYLNQGKFTSQGVDGSVKFRQDAWEVSSTFTHQKFIDERSPVLRRPLNYGSVALAWFYDESLESSIRYRFFDSRKDLDLTGKMVKLSGFEAVEVGMKKTFADTDLGVQVLNIFNRDYEELYGYSVMPRSVFLHFGRKFQ
ncbi:MAG TPA: TonB-dependent receptor [Bacteriovoracaceae bacterium]|nr:TonB-dependent receptor [Bacteriovoracaceae bacterium]